MIDDGINRVVKGGRGFGFYVVRPATDTEYHNLNERVVVSDGPFTTREQAQARADALNEQRARIIAAKPSGRLLVLPALTAETEASDVRIVPLDWTDDHGHGGFAP